MKTRFVGNCQICERDQKLHLGRMVHHGYRRPGDGAIHGDCPGVEEVPYEVSCALVKTYKVGVQNRAAHLEARLADLRAGRVAHLRVLRKLGGWRQPSEWVEYAAGVTEPSRWVRAVEDEVAAHEAELRLCAREIERCTQRIAAWEPAPLRTIEEEESRARVDREARAAEKQVARAARATKDAATKAKQQALADRRKAIREGFEAQFRALAERTEPLAYRQVSARELLNDLRKTKYRSWLSRYDLQCEEAFVALGLATQDGVNGRGRPYLRWIP